MIVWVFHPGRSLPLRLRGKYLVYTEYAIWLLSVEVRRKIRSAKIENAQNMTPNWTWTLNSQNYPMYTNGSGKYVVSVRDTDDPAITSLPLPCGSALDG